MVFSPDKNRVRGSGKRLTPGSAKKGQMGKAKSVSSIIAERRGGLKDEASKEKDEAKRENTPLQVVENFRDLIREAQAARVMMVRAKEHMGESLKQFNEAGSKEHKAKFQKDFDFFKKQLFYWTQMFAIRRTDMTDMQKRYGAGLEAAHREFVGDMVNFYHFQKKFAALAAVERAIANYQPPLLGIEEDQSDRGKRLQALVGETLAEEQPWDFEELKQYVPAKGEEAGATKEDVNILDELVFAFGEADAKEVAAMMQAHFHEHDEPQEAEIDVAEVTRASLAQLNKQQESLLAQCEEEWEHPAVQRLWFEHNLHEMIVARLKEERVLELPSTIKLLNNIARIERNHPHTTVGVALVGDPGVGKTTVIEHYLRKIRREYVYIDMTEEVTRYTLLGSPQSHTESQMDFFRRMSEEFGELDDADVEAMIKRNAEKMEKGFGSLGVEERQALSVAMLREELEHAEQIKVDPEFRKAFERELEIVRGAQANLPADQAQTQALAALQAKIDQGDMSVSHLVQAKRVEVERSGVDMDEAQLTLAAQTEAKRGAQDVHTALNLDDAVKGKLMHVKEALSRVARMKFQDEAANRFSDLTKKNGWRDGLVIHALRTGKSILFDEYNGAKDWKLLHHIFTLRPGDTYKFGDKAGEEIPIPPDWRMYFTGNIQMKHGGLKLKEALVSRIGGQVLVVEPPPPHEEWMVTVASLSDANDRLVRDERDIVMLGFLVNDVFFKIREAMRNAGSPEIVPISFRMIANITEQLMNHRTQFARPTSVDRAVLDEIVNPYLQYPNTNFPIKGGDSTQMPSRIVTLLLDSGLLLSKEVEDEVIKWTGKSKEDLEKMREARKDQDWRKLMKEIQEKAAGAMTEAMPVSFIG